MSYKTLFIAFLCPFILSAQTFRDHLVWTFDVHFDFGKQEVQATYLPKLDSLAVALVSDTHYVVSLQAHTDAIGSDVANTLLSQHRAENVKKHLTSKNIDNQRITYIYLGESQPIADNTRDEGRQNNRRVSVRLMRRIPMTTISGIIKNDTGEILKDAKVRIRSRYFNDSTTTNASGYFELPAPKNQNVILDALAKDHFFISRRLVVQELPLKILDLQLMKVLVGRKMKLNDIFFYGNRTTLLPTSMPELKNLLQFMTLNEDYKIEIQGHINHPNSFPVVPESWEFKLSVGRAKTVYDYLIDNGISAERMTFVGYGNWFMVYPDAKTEEHQAANRRVEVKVTEKN
jgi:outer membrane protein OmpA-like peptidoglycan-associated protein